MNSASSPAPPTIVTNIATGVARNNVPNGADDSSPTLGASITDSAAPDAANVVANETATAEGVQSIGGTLVRCSTGRSSLRTADPGFSNVAAPAPTLANGLPGATNFVPNNVDRVRTTGVAGRYYDVTLRNAGTRR